MATTTRVVVDPVTRIEGHLRVEATVTDGIVTDAISSGTMWRGIELILQGRDPREAWAFCQRICGVCTTVHAVASVRAVENALGIGVPPNADIIRNMMFLAQFLQDHVVHFYHLHALDWVDLVSALNADPKAAAALQTRISPAWPNSSQTYFAGVQAKVKRFVESGQLGIFGNAYWGHSAYKLPPEGNLLAVAHYFEALQWQKEIVKIHALFGGKNPHPNYLVGGMASVLNPSGGEQALNAARLNSIGGLIQNAINLVEGMYLPDLELLARSYGEWSGIGRGLGNFMAYGDLPQKGIGDPSGFRFPQGALVDGILTPALNFVKSDEITEEVGHSWYTYPAGSKPALHPSNGVTDPRYAGPPPPFQRLDENGKYSWVKAPRWNGHAMEVGPLARVLVGYASNRPEFVALVNDALARLGWTKEQLISTMGRTLARGLETKLCARWLKEEYDALMANVRRGVFTTANSAKWDPSTWTPATGVGFTEAPRGACAHWIRIGADKKIANYQIVVPSTWNASPKDDLGRKGAYESALLNTPVADTGKPLEILRTIHSFDPCLACATHVISNDGRSLAEVVVR
jgi:hydrogenase large subunit